MATYLLNCPCGADLHVDSSLAGGQVVCNDCGESVDVPSLRLLKQLPRLDEPQPEEHKPKELVGNESTDVVRNLGAIIVIICVLALSLLLVFRFRSITGFTASDAISLGERHIDSLNMLQTWEMWGEINEMGLGSRDQVGLPALEARRLAVMYTLMGVVTLIGLAGAVMFVSGSKSNPPNDNRP